MKPDIEIFMFIDALGWDTVSRSDFMKDLLPNRKPVQMQFGYSCSAIPTILSGRTPAEHGHLGLFRFAPDDSPFKRLGWLESILWPRSFWMRGRVRHWLSKAVKRLYGFTGYFQLYQMPFGKLSMMDYCEKRDLFAPHGLGDVENLRDMLERTGLKFHISDWHLGDAENVRLAKSAIAEGCRFLFIYNAEFDGFMHEHVGDWNAIPKKLEWYGTQITSLLSFCDSLKKSVRFTLFSDHGMTPLTATIDVKSAVDASGLVFGRDYGACYDSTMARFTYKSPDAKEKIHAILSHFGDNGHWLTPEEERKYGIFREDRLFGDEIFFVNPGVQIVPSDMGSKPLNGMHGFEPSDKYSLAMIMSNDAIPDYLMTVADYYRLMRQRAEEMAESEGGR
ncbi:MAG: alkaline phosphatase family protein [Victivallales bacterium]|nr:alkaline phosphatase family protein [Victivallales bacterium]